MNPFRGLAAGFREIRHVQRNAQRRAEIRVAVGHGVAVQNHRPVILQVVHTAAAEAIRLVRVFLVVHQIPILELGASVAVVGQPRQAGVDVPGQGQRGLQVIGVGVRRALPGEGPPKKLSHSAVLVSWA